MRSAADGWAITSSVASPTAGLINLPAGEEVFGQMTSQVPEFGSSAGWGFIGIAPDGSVLGIDRSASYGGVNVFGWDCINGGVAIRFKADLLGAAP